MLCMLGFSEPDFRRKMVLCHIAVCLSRAGKVRQAVDAGQQQPRRRPHVYTGLKRDGVCFSVELAPRANLPALLLGFLRTLMCSPWGRDRGWRTVDTRTNLCNLYLSAFALPGTREGEHLSLRRMFATFAFLRSSCLATYFPWQASFVVWYDNSCGPANTSDAGDTGDVVLSSMFAGAGEIWAPRICAFVSSRGKDDLDCDLKQ